MGAKRIRPAANAVCVDAIWIAEQLGRPVEAVYKETREGILPAPVSDAMARGVHPQNWRWSRARILNALDGAA